MKYLVLFIFAFVQHSLFAQTGVASYYEHVKFDISIDSTQPGFNSAMQQQLLESLKKQAEKEYTLTFNAKESLYKIVPKLAAPQPANNGGIAISVAGSSDILYKNIQSYTYVNETDMMGKAFLIKDSLPKKNWVLTQETKGIGEYTCYKATYSYSRTISKFVMGENGPTDSKEEEEVVVTAWYTPEIPVSNGPNDYQGLPGLILEIHDGKRTLVCNKITLNAADAEKIEIPKKGKVVNQKEFDEIQEKKMQEFINQHSGGNRRGDGSTISISIGG